MNFGFVKVQQNFPPRLCYATLALDYTFHLRNNKFESKHKAPMTFPLASLCYFFFLLTENLFLWRISEGEFSALFSFSRR